MKTPASGWSLSNGSAPPGSRSEYVELNQQGDETWDQRRALLVHQRELLQERIAEMRQSLEKLNHKIAYYDRGPENKGDCRC